MPKTDKQVFVHQMKSRNNEIFYIVDKTINCVNPSINAEISKEQVIVLIGMGVKVTVTSAK